MTRRPATDPGPMDTANGTLRLGDRARIIGGPDRGRRGTITHLYARGVFAGLVVIDDIHVSEGVNVTVDGIAGEETTA
ncbi:MAG: hypothetical protein Q8M74_02910 [Chloroflexota bacterium]|nr:hypothetical protein [Chloroflexota bacterium]